MHTIDKMPGVYTLGYVGENKFRSIEIDMTPWLVDYPNGVASIVHVRPEESLDKAYLAATTFENGILKWQIGLADLGPNEGYGQMQIGLYETNESGEHVGKSVIIKTRVLPSLVAVGDIPDGQKAALDQMAEIKAEVVQTAQAVAEDKQTIVEAKESVSQDAQAVAEAKDEVARNRQAVDEAKEAIARDKQTVAEAQETVSRDKQTVVEAKEAVARDKQTVTEARDEAVQAKRDSDISRTKAEEAAEKAEYSANVAGYMDFYIDQNGYLIYRHTKNLDNVSFELREGVLYAVWP